MIASSLAKPLLTVSWISIIPCYFDFYIANSNHNDDILLITDIESKLKRIEEDPEGSGTSHLFNCIQGVSSISNRAFGPLFERQVGRIPVLN